MNILWITNIPFPASSRLLGRQVEIGGGWMHALAIQLINTNKVRLAVATSYLGDNMQTHYDDKISYYILPRKRDLTKYDQSLETYWIKVVEEFNPDVIHIHGTEYTHGLACMKACPTRNYVISIQGMVSVYSEYHFAGINPIELIRFSTLNDLKRMDTVLHRRSEMVQRGKFEIEYIKRAKHIIGRTSWDYTHTQTINPTSRYHFCNEVLRESFYNSNKWNFNEKISHRIFMSQANSQRQGLHQVLKALSIVKEFFPDIKLRVAGLDISGGSKWVHRINSYGHYIRSLIQSLNLGEHVLFLGGLNEEKMVEEFKNAHIFICASVIENSPNSLGEAQILGTPCIASFVGGVPDMVVDRETGLLYRFEEYKMLAYKIIEIFNNDNLARNLSAMGQKAAANRHNRGDIVTRMQEIYSSIVEEKGTIH